MHLRVPIQLHICTTALALPLVMFIKLISLSWVFVPRQHASFFICQSRWSRCWCAKPPCLHTWAREGVTEHVLSSHPLFCSNSCFDVWIFLCIWALKQCTIAANGPQEWISINVSVSVSSLMPVSTGEGSGLLAPTHGTQTKQQDECFLTPTWHWGTPFCPCGLIDWQIESPREQNNGRIEQRRGWRNKESLQEV